MPHPLGEIRVEFKVDGERLNGTVTLPAGLDGRFVWNGEEVRLQTGIQEVEF